MALVDYASSSEDEEQVSDHAVSVFTKQPINAFKRKKESEQELPPLPAQFHDLYASNVRTTTHDDPALHGGRKRIKPHVEGNWPTHIYIEWWPRSRDLETLSKLIKSLSTSASTEDVKVESLLESELGAPLPLHISLSRSLTLTLSNKASFLAQVQSAVAAGPPAPSRPSPSGQSHAHGSLTTRKPAGSSSSRLLGRKVTSSTTCFSSATKLGRDMINLVCTTLRILKLRRRLLNYEMSSIDPQRSTSASPGLSFLRRKLSSKRR